MATTTNAIIQEWASRQALSAAQKAKEKELRPQLIAAFGNLRTARYELGRLLVEYRKHFKGIYQSLYDAIGIEERTARNYMDDYERASRVPASLREAAASRGYDLAQMRHQSLCNSLAEMNGTKAADVASVLDRAIKAYEASKKKTKATDIYVEPEPSFDVEPAAKKLPSTAQDAPVAGPSSAVAASVSKDTASPSVPPFINFEECSPELQQLLRKLTAVLRDPQRQGKELEEMLMYSIKLRLNKLKVTRKAA